ncbi:MAG: nucleotide pyrophosphohydrolase [Oligoflexia bacterium]|nr:nucleotide pyrophosphohydrolase [Oligoflexia bacterium]
MPDKIQNSDQNNTVESLKDRVARFCEERNWDKEHKPKELAIGVVTEASELLEIFRFLSESACLEAVTDSKTRQKISEELADTLCFILRFAQLYQFDLSSCLKDKLAKNAIKYPVSPH